MNKKHIVTSIGVVLLTTGIIGGIWSGIDAMPKVINNIQVAEEKYNEEEVLYKSEINLSKLNINSKVSNVIIKKYDGKEVVVKRKGNKNISTITTKESNSELTINEDFKNNTKLAKNIDDIVRYFVNEIYTSQYSEMTVYIPENIDLRINTNNGGLYINDDLKLNNVDFNTSYGHISLSENTNTKSLNIKSDSGISLQLSELYCSENVNLKSDSIGIYDDISVKDKSKIPENVKILINSDYYDHEALTINTNAPIAKNLEISSNSTVSLELPLLDYKFDFDIKTSRGIGFNDDNYEKYMGTALEQYFKYGRNQDEYDDDEEYKQKELVGVINDNLKDNSIVYNVNIKSSIVRFN